MNITFLLNPCCLTEFFCHTSKRKNNREHKTEKYTRKSITNTVKKPKRKCINAANLNLCLSILFVMRSEKRDTRILYRKFPIAINGIETKKNSVKPSNSSTKKKNNTNLIVVYKAQFNFHNNVSSN